ncbi:hypothetical protein JCM15093_522 [Bacteroides graminisolvens DSM 19988 = JCM 15093]|uniref:Uncharacterized protein n=1 Tax=Bacteroides graminisolvens DSM 19988 = JCM 15093 TaxID=1121097 RepID=A0A069CZ76_9BACE|nr:hypothetical protein JCM15093_522 [Bacteroides graminisolvens DSM 19988 = JCM 15093]
MKDSFVIYTFFAQQRVITNSKKMYICAQVKERCQSDRSGRTRNPLYGFAVPWV